MAALGHPIVKVSGRRTKEQQETLYAQGRTTGKPGAIITQKSGAPGDESLHQLGRATDFAFVDPKTGQPSYDPKHPWSTLGRMAKLHGLEWGGDWTSPYDPGHIQAPVGPNLGANLEQPTPVWSPASRYDLSLGRVAQTPPLKISGPVPGETTPLTPDEEKQYQTWLTTNKIEGADEPDSYYDYRGYWKDTKGAPYPPPGGKGHGPDTYKQHGHPTFSVESRYSTGPNDGGHWETGPSGERDQFVPAGAPGPGGAVPPGLVDVPDTMPGGLVDVPDTGTLAPPTPSTTPQPPDFRRPLIWDPLAEAAPWIGAGAGAMIGGGLMAPTALYGGIAGPYYGAVQGATIGGAAGEAIRQMYRTYFGVDPNPSWQEAGMETVLSGAKQGAAEALFGYPSFWASRSLAQGGVSDVIAAQRQYGLRLSPTEQTGTLKWAQEAFLRASGSARAIAQRAAAAGDAAGLQAVREALRRLATAHEELAPIGEAIKKGVETAKAGFENYPATIPARAGLPAQRGPLQTLYDHVVKTGPIMDMRPVIDKFLDDMRREGVPLADQRAVLRALPPPLRPPAQTVNNAYYLTFEQAATFRSRLGAKTRTAVPDIFQKPGVQTAASSWYGDLSNFMFQRNPDFQSVSNLYNAKRQAFKAPFMKVIAGSSPDTIIRAMGASPEIRTVTALKESFLDLAQHAPNPADRVAAKNAWDSLRRRWFEDFIIQAGPETPGVPATPDLPGMLDRMNKMNGVIHQMYEYDPQGRELVDRARDIAAAVAQRRAVPSGEGKNLIKVGLSTLFGVGTAAATQRIEPAVAAGAITYLVSEFGGGFVSYLMYNPAISRQFVNSMRVLRTGNTQAAKLAIPALGRIVGYYMLHRDEVDRAIEQVKQGQPPSPSGPVPYQLPSSNRLQTPAPAGR